MASAAAATTSVATEAAYKIVLVRHGESQWNALNLFTGWHDVELSDEGIEEAHACGKLLKSEGYSFDLAYSSLLKRAIHTMNIALQDMDEHWIPIKRSWRLNERHYGGLTGLNKVETAAKHGDEMVHIWRRSYDVPPPPLDMNDEKHARHDRRYNSLTSDILPSSECLKDVVQRMLPLWYDSIVPDIKDGKKLIIFAHGNSIRALVKHLDKISDEEIPKLNIPTGIPLVYELDADLKPIKHYFLGDADAVAAKQNAVANQAKGGK